MQCLGECHLHLRPLWWLPDHLRLVSSTWSRRKGAYIYIYILHVYNCIYNIYGSDIVVHELNGKDMK